MIRIRLKRAVILYYSLLAYFCSIPYAHAENILDIFRRTSQLMRNAALILGPGIGILLCLSGILKLRKKDEDPREFSKGILYIVSGIMATIVGLIIRWVLAYYGAENEYNANII